MRKNLLWIALLVMSLTAALPTGAQNLSSGAGAVVLEIENEMSYIREGWQQPVMVQAGTILDVDDLVFPQDTSLLVLCPDGKLKDFVPGELFPNDKLNCAVPRENYVLNIGRIDVPSLQRGGRQDPTIPYLISPRGTLVRSQTITLYWNAPSEVMEYQLRVMGGGVDALPQTSFAPEDVTQGEIASTQLELNLQPNVPYTVEICVTFQDLRQGCTTDPGWASGTDVAFYYLPDPKLGSQDLQILEQDIVNARGEDTPESLYARAILVSQALYTTPTGEPLGLRAEAISLLNRLIDNYPDSTLAKSPQVYMLLGDLYGSVDLLLSAARTFQRATTFSTPCTEIAAQAYLGLALTTPNNDTVSNLLNQALDEYYCLLQPAAFANQYASLCEAVGDSCADFEPLETFEG